MLRKLYTVPHFCQQEIGKHGIRRRKTPLRGECLQLEQNRIIRAEGACDWIEHGLDLPISALERTDQAADRAIDFPPVSQIDIVVPVVDALGALSEGIAGDAHRRRIFELLLDVF